MYLILLKPIILQPSLNAHTNQTISYYLSPFNLSIDIDVSLKISMTILSVQSLYVARGLRQFFYIADFFSSKTLASWISCVCIKNCYRQCIFYNEWYKYPNLILPIYIDPWSWTSFVSYLSILVLVLFTS